MRSFDVVIVGGGVAGTAVSLALHHHAPHLTCAIIERGNYDTPRIGETLPPQTAVILQQLGLWPSFLAQHFLPAHGTAAAWGQPQPYANDFVFTTHGYGWHLDRQAFDCWLAHEAVARGAALYKQTRLAGQQQEADGWMLRLQTAVSAEAIHARFVVDATGRLATFARQQGSQKQKADDLVSIYAFVEAATADSYALVEAIEGGWWYSARLPNGRLAVTLMTDRDLAQQHQLRQPTNWQQWLAMAPHTARRLGNGGEKTAVLHLTAAHSQRLQTAVGNGWTVGNGWLAVGDAATTFDPLSSQGIFKALRHATLAAYAIDDTLQGKAAGLPKYQKLIDLEFNSYLQTRRDYYRQEQRWPTAPFWQRRH